ncbi:MAG: S-methyl-5'-thioadenosine phosphorylase [Deltaproteobacteria bacterium]|nr:S-methyl-5'-thioadenosine phosphorylase [Deltaproteobacteria bacterium]
MTHPSIGVLGGSGFYDLPGVTNIESVEVDTPFGRPADSLTIGSFSGRRVVFLPRHGRRHSLSPTEVNARANLYALKLLGATHVVSISAVGSLRETISPGDVVVPRQFIDRTVARPSTFFGQGVVAHVSLADPVCDVVASALVDSATVDGGLVHPSGTYVCIEGPQFGTRAESDLMRGWGADVVGMTNLPEARLAREAELCYATLALVTDYDCWRARDEVTVTDALAVLRANVDKARRILGDALATLDPARTCSCQRSLDAALVTPVDAIDDAARRRLGVILSRRLGGAP